MDRTTGRFGDTEEMLKSIEEKLTKTEELPYLAKSLIYEDVCFSLHYLSNKYKECGSPIEFLMFMNLRGTLDFINDYYGTQFYQQLQARVKTNGHNYRIDILVAESFRENDKNATRIAIECDGHDFHEKTKEQAQHDKQRDRYLQMEGFKVMRFTGSEIYNHPSKCATDVGSMIESLIGS
ncbi:DUF559 domain-containing protein [Sporolactobacillus shoreicorticis]|uniref:Endonuclease domain-containing protein n=1 Tax=Sporolactobacillus shoreicorticis TaxID=1923877 RepID=A0ABW5S7A5_9BACL|nr:DUF559 domain-containing protein [Sporolactobacillus shoreicorticis]MCO7127777.1 DUF559 domain-containing protein [Sporolactobacillus shoreicorticis]